MELKGRRLFIYMTIATLAITLLFLLILIAGKNKTKQMPFTESGPQKTAIQIPEQYLNPTALPAMAIPAGETAPMANSLTRVPETLLAIPLNWDFNRRNCIIPSRPG
jgi:hypothetical protein